MLLTQSPPAWLPRGAGGSPYNWPTGWRQLSIRATRHSQGGWYNNLAATGLILLWKATVYNTTLSPIHSLYIWVISASWNGKTTFFFFLHSFVPVIPEEPAPWWDIKNIVKHHQLSNLLSPNIFCIWAAGKQMYTSDSEDRNDSWCFITSDGMWEGKAAAWTAGHSLTPQGW